MNFYQEIVSELRKKKLTSSQLTILKRNLAVKHKLNAIPSNVDILIHAEIKDIPKLKKQLLTKPVRTISGVSPVAIMTKPFPCPHGKCIMCPGGIQSEFGDVPQSYTGKEPAAMRGIRNKFDSYLQVFNRLEQYTLLGHNCEKVELILMGGTFPSFPLDYQEEFVKYAFKAMNDFSELFYSKKANDNEDKKEEFDYVSFKKFFELPAADIKDKERTERIQKKLLELKGKCKLKDKCNPRKFKNKFSVVTRNFQKKFLGRQKMALPFLCVNKGFHTLFTITEEHNKNETAQVRCVALCIETRPDYGMLEHGSQMLELGCTRVELGIQSVYDEALKNIKRGHTTAETKESIRTLKDLGFKVAGHYMPGLPRTSKEKDIKGMKQLFENPDYKPDMLKIYPCMVVKGTELYQRFKEGKFKPLTAEDAAELIAESKKFIPEYCRIQRVQRDIPSYQIEAGVKMTNLRQYLHEKFPVKCRCIRCREPKGNKINWQKIIIKVNEYEASGGKEFFISAEDASNDLLIGFCRLRFPSRSLRKEITTKSALVRELHVYGTATAIGDEGLVQHRGWGRKLMKKAEEIALAGEKNKIVVISGVGAREYYRKMGYEREGPYMVKNL